MYYDFSGKGEAESDSVAVVRSPKDTRPLCMKNTFNKLIVDANCKCLNSEFSQITHHTQNRFVGGRNFLKNIVDLDASGRIYSCAYEGRRSCSLQGTDFVKNGDDLTQLGADLAPIGAQSEPKPLPKRGGCLAEVQLAPLRHLHRHGPNSNFVNFEKKLKTPNQVFFQKRST